MRLLLNPWAKKPGKVSLAEFMRQVGPKWDVTSKEEWRVYRDYYDSPYTDPREYMKQSVLNSNPTSKGTYQCADPDCLGMIRKGETVSFKFGLPFHLRHIPSDNKLQIYNNPAPYRRGDPAYEQYVTLVNLHWDAVHTFGDGSPEAHAALERIAEFNRTHKSDDGFHKGQWENPRMKSLLRNPEYPGNEIEQEYIRTHPAYRASLDKIRSAQDRENELYQAVIDAKWTFGSDSKHVRKLQRDFERIRDKREQLEDQHMSRTWKNPIFKSQQANLMVCGTVAIIVLILGNKFYGK